MKMTECPCFVCQAYLLGRAQGRNESAIERQITADELSRSGWDAAIDCVCEKLEEMKAPLELYRVVRDTRLK